MARCAALTRAGTACKGTPKGGSTWCYVHNPASAEEMRRHGKRGGKRGGRGRPGSELQDLKGEIRDVITDVLKGEVKTGPAAVALQGYNALLRAEKLSLDIREQTELIERLEGLEAVLEYQKGEHRGHG